MLEQTKNLMEQLFLSQLSKTEVKQFAQERSLPYRELMAYYRCAMMEVETKFNVLNEELSLQYDRNPIETIKMTIITIFVLYIFFSFIDTFSTNRAVVINSWCYKIRTSSVMSSYSSAIFTSH